MASLVKTDKISTTAGGAQEFTLPAADGTANQHLKTDGSGVLGWATPPTGIALTGSTNTWIPTITGADALAGTANFTYDGNVLDVKNSGTASSINLYCETGNAHYIKIKSGPHASATSYTLTMPNAPPSVSGYALTATTAGVASWASVDNSAAFFAKNTANQTLGDDTNTKIVLNSETYDSDGAFDPTTNYRFTVPTGKGGKYLIYAAIDCKSSTLTEVNGGSAYIYLNGSEVEGSLHGVQYPMANPAYEVQPVVAGVMVLAEDDYIELWGNIDVASGTPTVRGDTARTRTYMGAHRLIGV